MEKWMEINGRKLLAESFISTLNYDTYLFRNQESKLMVYGIQEITRDYLDDRERVDDCLDHYLKRHNLELPEIRELPEAIECLFNQMQQNLRLDLSYLLDKSLEETNRLYQLILEEKQKEKECLKFINNLKLEESTNIKKVQYLMKLQHSKIQAKEYVQSKDEILATNFLCELFISQISSPDIPSHLLKRAVENEYVSESDISNLLENKYHCEEDYESYEEVLRSCELDMFTCIKTDDLLELCLDELLKILGITSLEENKNASKTTY